MNTRKIFPKTFFGRSLVIILIPVILLQLVLIYFFYERHWDDVGRRLALALGGQISYIIKTLEEKNFSTNDIEIQFKKAESDLFAPCAYIDTAAVVGSIVVQELTRLDLQILIPLPEKHCGAILGVVVDKQRALENAVLHVIIETQATPGTTPSIAPE